MCACVDGHARTCVCEQLTRTIDHRVLDEDLGRIRRRVWWSASRTEMSSVGGVGLV